MATDVTPKSNKALVVGLILGATLVSGVGVYYGFSLGTTTKSVAESNHLVTGSKISALGRLEPATEVIELGAPLNLSEDRLAELLVKQGDLVKTGQTIAILASNDTLLAAVAQAEEEIQVAKAKLAQVKAGAKTGEIEAQKAEIGRLEVELAGEINTNRITIARLEAELAGEQAEQQATIARMIAELAEAQKDFERYQQLAQEGVIAESDLDRRDLKLQTTRELLTEAQAKLRKTEETLQKQIQEQRKVSEKRVEAFTKQISQAKATLLEIAEVRPVDVETAAMELKLAIAAKKKAQVAQEQAYIRSPISGQVLAIRTRPGEKISDRGIVEIGETQQMLVVAEVYQTDIQKVRLGQNATITSTSFEKTLTGTVSEIGRQVIRQSVFSNQPGENFDRRVVEVKIKLSPADSELVAGLTNLQVYVLLEPS